MEKEIETIKEELKTLERKMLIATVLFSLAFIFATLQIVNLIDLIDLNRQYVETLVESNKRDYPEPRKDDHTHTDQQHRSNREVQ